MVQGTPRCQNSWYKVHVGTMVQGTRRCHNSWYNVHVGAKIVQLTIISLSMILSLHCSPLLMLMFALPMRIVNTQDREECRRWKNRRIEGWTSCSGKDSTHNGRRVKELGRSNKREHGRKNSIHSRRRVKEGGRLQSRIFFASSLSCFLLCQIQETNGLSF